MGLVILIGASGAGKTTIAESFSRLHPQDAVVLFFDRIGVPSVEQMIADHESCDGWQRAMTIEWMATIADRLRAGKNILFEGQTRPSFVAEAASLAGIEAYRLILVDCDDDTRVRRLRDERRQAELANPEMLAWAAFLRNAAREGRHTIVDTSAMPLEESIAQVRTCFDAP